MRTLLILAALGWVVSLPWITLFGYLALIVAATVMLWCLSASIERRAVFSWPGGNTIDPDYVAALETMVGETEALVEALKAEIERLRVSRAVPEVNPKAALCARVGLSAQAPDWLILAARRAYRVALHPDRHPAHRKQEAERRFQEAEAIFDQIGVRG